MAKKKIEKIWEIDQEGRKYVDFIISTVDENGNPKEITEREYAELGGSWAIGFITSGLKQANGFARRTLIELEGLTDEEIRIAYLNDKNHGGNEYLELIKLGEILKKASK